MARKKTHAPLNVLINNRLAGRLEKQNDGAIKFAYDLTWLDWEYRFPISLSLPLQAKSFRGEQVVAVFDNLLPDSDKVRSRIAERTGANGVDSYSLLERIGRDCVGAMQFLPDGVEHDARAKIEGEPISESEIERMLANLETAPLGIDDDHDFRISVAGAQEKTALLWHDGQWKRPIGTTPTTHILKPQIGEIPTAGGMIDLTNSVENEHYCLKLMEGFGLKIAQTDMAMFGARKVLVIKRFDRQWHNDERLIRLPQEDCCQALGIPSSRKYQNTVQGGENGPSAMDILDLLQSSDDPMQDQADFFKSQIIFWLIGATDGHGKNFSISLKPGGGFTLTPFYDVLSAQPVFDKKQISHNKYKLAMSVGNSRKYQILRIHGRHFVETAKEAGIGPTIITKIINEVMTDAKSAPDYALEKMPKDFAGEIHESIVAAINSRLHQLETAFDEL